MSPPKHIWTIPQTVDLVDFIQKSPMIAKAFLDPKSTESHLIILYQKKLCLQLLQRTEWMEWMRREEWVVLGEKGLRPTDKWGDDNPVANRLEWLQLEHIRLCSRLRNFESAAAMGKDSNERRIWEDYRRKGEHDWYFAYQKMFLTYSPVALAQAEAACASASLRNRSMPNGITAEVGKLEDGSKDKGKKAEGDEDDDDIILIVDGQPEAKFSDRKSTSVTPSLGGSVPQVSTGTIRCSSVTSTTVSTSVAASKPTTISPAAGPSATPSASISLLPVPPKSVPAPTSTTSTAASTISASSTSTKEATKAKSTTPAPARKASPPKPNKQPAASSSRISPPVAPVITKTTATPTVMTKTTATLPATTKIAATQSRSTALSEKRPRTPPLDHPGSSAPPSAPAPSKHLSLFQLIGGPSQSSSSTPTQSRPINAPRPVSQRPLTPPLDTIPPRPSASITTPIPAPAPSRILSSKALGKRPMRALEDTPPLIESTSTKRTRSSSRTAKTPQPTNNAANPITIDSDTDEEAEEDDDDDDIPITRPVSRKPARRELRVDSRPPTPPPESVRISKSRPATPPLDPSSKKTTPTIFNPNTISRRNQPETPPPATPPLSASKAPVPIRNNTSSRPPTPPTSSQAGLSQSRPATPPRFSSPLSSPSPSPPIASRRRSSPIKSPLTPPPDHSHPLSTANMERMISDPRIHSKEIARLKHLAALRNTPEAHHRAQLIVAEREKAREEIICYSEDEYDGNSSVDEEEEEKSSDYYTGILMEKGKPRLGFDFDYGEPGGGWYPDNSGMDFENQDIRGGDEDDGGDGDAMIRPPTPPLPDLMIGSPSLSDGELVEEDIQMAGSESDPEAHAYVQPDMEMEVGEGDITNHQDMQMEGSEPTSNMVKAVEFSQDIEGVQNEREDDHQMNHDEDDPTDGLDHKTMSQTNHLEEEIIFFRPSTPPSPHSSRPSTPPLPSASRPSTPPLQPGSDISSNSDTITATHDEYSSTAKEAQYHPSTTGSHPVNTSDIPRQLSAPKPSDDLDYLSELIGGEVDEEEDDFFIALSGVIGMSA